MADVTDRNQEATLFVGELDAQVTESLLWELFLQVGPVGEWQARVLRCCVLALTLCGVARSQRAHSAR